MTEVFKDLDSISYKTQDYSERLEEMEKRWRQT